MNSVKACKAMLDGMAMAITDLKPNFLSVIRIVILQQPVFQAFRSEANFAHTATSNRGGKLSFQHVYQSLPNQIAWFKCPLLPYIFADQSWRIALDKLPLVALA